MLREVTVKIGLERIDMQEGITVETLLDSGVTGLVMSSEFAKKTGLQAKKVRKTNTGEKYGWNIQSRRTNRKYCGSKYILSGT